MSKKILIPGKENVIKEQEPLIEDAQVIAENTEAKTEMTMDQIVQGYKEKAYELQKEFPNWFTVTRFIKDFFSPPPSLSPKQKKEMENQALAILEQFKYMSVMVSKNDTSDQFRTKYKFDIEKKELKVLLEKELEETKRLVKRLKERLKGLS